MPVVLPVRFNNFLVSATITGECTRQSGCTCSACGAAETLLTVPGVCVRCSSISSSDIWTFCFSVPQFLERLRWPLLSLTNRWNSALTVNASSMRHPTRSTWYVSVVLLAVNE